MRERHLTMRPSRMRALAWVCLLLLAVNVTGLPHLHEEDHDEPICALCAASDDGVVVALPGISFEPPTPISTVAAMLEVSEPDQIDCLWRAPKQGPPGLRSMT